MSNVVKLRDHFGRLVDFSGREDRASFWPYAALVYGILTVASVLAMMVVMRSMHIDAGRELPIMPDFTLFAGAMVVMTGIAIILYAAAVVRRLHDGGLSGFWGLMPLPFLVFSMIRMWGVFTSFGTGIVSFDGLYLIALSNALYMVAMITLIVLLSRRSDRGSNRYGEVAQREH